MTIDERLDRLTERHEALAQSVEMLRDTVHDMARTQAAESRSLHESVQSLAASTAALLKVAEIHERRLGEVERKLAS